MFSRTIEYIYIDYADKRKSKGNIGFVKMIVNESDSRMIVYLKGLYLEKGMKGTVYLIGIDHKEHLIGELSIENSSAYGEYQIKKNGMTCNYSINDEIIGIAIYIGNIRCISYFSKKEETKGESKDLWSKMKYIYPSVHPFEKDEQGKEYLSITPNEISFFAQEDQLLRQNRFLLQGYQNYKYITQTSHLNKCLCTLKIQ